MQNLAIGLVLVGLALLVCAVLLVYQFGPDFGLSTPPSTEHRPPEDENATLKVTVGGDDVAEEINREAQHMLSLEHARDLIEKQPRTLTSIQRDSLDGQKRFEHVVRKGETLTSLARDYLGDDKLWKAILEANPTLTRPEDLREGQTILIPTKEAR